MRQGYARAQNLLNCPLAMDTIQIPPLSFDRFAPIVGRTRARRLRHTLEDARDILDGRVVWHVNSTRTGGGVAEMLQTLIGYERGAGLDVQWVVMEGDAPFFAITKRIHHNLHGRSGDGCGFSSEDRERYLAVSRRNARNVLRVVRPGDVVILHDPQTAGLAEPLRRHGAVVVWRCHVGCNAVNAAVHQAWEFLEPLLRAAHAYVFSRPEYVPAWLRDESVFIMPPAIDAFSSKNEPVSRGTVRAILRHVGLLEGRAAGSELTFRRTDGTEGVVRRGVTIHQTGPVPDWRTPTVTQVSRWDPLKDMQGVMDGFAGRLERLGDAHLVLVGPDVSGVTDDPEGALVLEDCIARWQCFPSSVRDRIHLVILPMDDVEENAIMVNAIQRHSTVVVQKSLEEGFGLTVTEAMWKGRAIVASAVGGIQDQIVHGRHGLLLEDPADLEGFGDALEQLLSDHALVRRFGRNARRRAIAHFLAPRRLRQFVDLIYEIEGRTRETRAA
jgi:trehalose synthase